VRVEGVPVVGHPDRDCPAPLLGGHAARGGQQARPGDGAGGELPEEAAAAEILARHGVSFREGLTSTGSGDPAAHRRGR
jgi:hypothetical protein